MKPRRTPLCFFSKASRYWVRSAMIADMSTSLKVVSMAALFWASFRRRAMVRRRRVILTRSSPSPAMRGGAAGRGGAAAGCAARARNASTSPLVMRPSLPEPAPRAVGARFCSSISFAADGIGARTGAGGASGPGAGAGAAAGRATGPSGRGGGRTPAVGLAAGPAIVGVTPASIIPSRAPTSTSLPSSALIEVSTPAVGAVTSTVTLSVSSSTTGSSAATASPGCFIQRAIVAVVTLSPKVGTLISVGIRSVP